MTTVGALAVVMPAPGAPLERERRPVPEPAADEVLVRVRASSMNYHDLVNLQGLIAGPWPRVPMTDAAGEVVAVGRAVRGVEPGARVISTFHPAWLDGPPTRDGKWETPGDGCDGWLQQYRLATARSLAPAPAHLDDLEAATLPCAATTAWSALEAAATGPGDVVVAQGTGGVSLFVLQLAKARGARVVLTSSSPAKLVVGARLGADHLVDTSAEPQWHQAVRACTDGRGADLVVDVGGPSTLGHSVRAVRTAGTVAIVGVLGGAGDARIPVAVAMTRNVHLVGITVGSVAAHRAMSACVREAQIRPHISHRLAWEDLPEAVSIMRRRAHVGKIAIAVP